MKFHLFRIRMLIKNVIKCNVIKNYTTKCHEISHIEIKISFEISLRLDKLLEFKKYFFSIPNLPLLLIVDPVI